MLPPMTHVHTTCRRSAVPAVLHQRIAPPVRGVTCHELPHW